MEEEVRDEDELSIPDSASIGIEKSSSDGDSQEPNLIEVTDTNPKPNQSTQLKTQNRSQESVSGQEGKRASGQDGKMAPPPSIAKEGNRKTNMASPLRGNRREDSVSEMNMILIIIIPSIVLVVAIIVGIWLFLRKRYRQSNKKNAVNETDNVVERLTQVINQLEETSDDKKSQLASQHQPGNNHSTSIKNHAHRNSEFGKNETAPKRQKLDEHPKDDISPLVEILTKLTDEYEETYQDLRQRISDRYKQLQEASQYIDSQVEKLNKLTSNNLIETEGGIQSGKNPPCPPFSKEENSLKYSEVYKLAEQKVDHVEIARRTELPIGEVDLILSLNNRAESNDDDDKVDEGNPDFGIQN